MNTLVTGASGFLGLYVGRATHRSGGTASARYAAKAILASRLPGRMSRWPICATGRQ